MKEYRIVLGIEIGRNFLRAAEVEHRENGFFLSRIAEQQLVSLDADELVQKTSFLINEEGILSRTVSIAIDTTLTKRGTMEIDSDLESADVVDFLRADIDFHNNFSGEQFVPAYEVIDKTQNGQNEIFYAAVGDKLLKEIKDFCTRCGLDLQFVDLDHSCSELCLNKIQPRAKSHVLITVKEKQIEGSYSKNGRRTAYKFQTYTSEAFYPVTKMAQSLESGSKEYLEKIYVTGQAADAFLLEMLQKNVDDRFEMVNPLQNLMLSPLASSKSHLTTSPHHFSAVIGAALK